MGKKDKFAKMQQSGGLSFEEMVKQATTVAAIEQQAEQVIPQAAAVTREQKTEDNPPAMPEGPAVPPVRYARLPNPQIPVPEINLVEQYCRQFDNMTKQDFVELAIIEKLHGDGDMTQEDFMRRYEEIRNRPARGHRKGMKTQTSR